MKKKTNLHLVKVTVHSEVLVALEIPEELDWDKSIKDRDWKNAAEHRAQVLDFHDAFHDVRSDYTYEDITGDLTKAEIRKKAAVFYSDEEYKDIIRKKELYEHKLSNFI